MNLGPPFVWKPSISRTVPTGRSFLQRYCVRERNTTAGLNTYFQFLDSNKRRKLEKILLFSFSEEYRGRDGSGLFRLTKLIQMRMVKWWKENNLQVLVYYIISINLEY